MSFSPREYCKTDKHEYVKKAVLELYCFEPEWAPYFEDEEKEDSHSLLIINKN